MISLERYRALFALPGLTRLFLSSLVGRLPIGMSGLAILMLVQSESGSFAEGGMATGCYVAGLAGVAPLLGRIIDRNGPRVTLLACALLFPTSMAALVTAVGAATPLVLVCAARAHDRSQRAGDAPLAPDHLADVDLGDPKLEHGRAVALDARDLDLVGAVHEALGQVDDELLQS